MNKTSTETFRHVYFNDDGVYLTVGPDRDGLGYIELCTDTEENKAYFGETRLTLEPAFAKALGEALILAANERTK